MVSFGSGSGCNSAGNGTGYGLCSDVGSPILNMELLIDGEIFEDFHIIQIRWKISSLTTFQINFGDPNRTNRFIREGSSVQVRLSWGDNPLVNYFSGTITKMTRHVSSGNVLVTGSGVDNGLSARDKNAWDSSFEYVSYSNKKGSEILADLGAQVDDLNVIITPYNNEPSLDYEASQNSKIIQNMTKVCEYCGYEYFVNYDGRMIVRPILEPVEGNATHMFLLGDKDDFTSLPDLPFEYIRSVSFNKDLNQIKNVYKVNGKNGIFGTGKNEFSINKYSREADDEYTDEGLTTIKSCEVVARRLGEINGEPRIGIGVKIRGNPNIRVGNIVYCDDLDRNIFTNLDNQYLKIYTKNDTISKGGWSSDIDMGSPKKDLSDIIKSLR